MSVIVCVVILIVASGLLAYELGRSRGADRTDALLTDLASIPTTTALSREIVAAVARNAGATRVALHMPEKFDPRRVECVASTHGRERSSPADVRSVLASGVAQESRREREVRLLLPVNFRGATIATLEIVLQGRAFQRARAAIDAVVSTARVALALSATRDEVDRLSCDLRAHVGFCADNLVSQQGMFDALADGLAITDDSGAIVRVNAAGRRLVGVDNGAGGIADPQNPLVQAMREGMNASGLEVAIADGASFRVVQMTIAKLNERVDSSAAVALFRDVTRERELEHQLRTRGKELSRDVETLERSTRLKSEFLANMSHELRTPLNAVCGFTEVLLDGTYGSLNERQQACASDVLAGGRHLLGLINDILDLSKIEAGRLELSIEDVDAADVVGQAVTMVRPQAAAKHIRLHVDVPRRDFILRADLDRARQIVVNLLSNAVKFTPVGGSVRVASTLAGDTAVRITVTDTGIGIAKEDAPKLFREFSQVDGSITRKFGGTGLGLAICKKLVEMHGGAIGLKSTLGEGSTFHFTIPSASPTVRLTFGALAPIRRSSARIPKVARAAEVLVIDRDGAAARVMVDALDAAGLPAIAVATMADARIAMAETSYRVAIADPALSDAPVQEVTVALEARFGRSIVYTSVLRREEFSGVSGSFCGKPLDRAAVVNAVRGAIARAGALRTALVVDGSPKDAAAVSTLLASEGFVVRTAENLREGRALLAGKPNLLVLDPELPDGDGAELLTPPPPSTAVVVLTSRELDEAAAAALRKRANLVLRKGTSSRTAFLDHVQDVLETRAARATVLAVDDNEQNLRLLSALLASRGYDVLEARDATSAMNIARAEHPDVILMDVMLPDVDGLSATRELKSDGLTSDIPVIAVTARAMPGDEQRAVSAGCCAYVTKPIDHQHLMRAVEAALHKAA